MSLFRRVYGHPNQLSHWFGIALEILCAAIMIIALLAARPTSRLAFSAALFLIGLISFLQGVGIELYAEDAQRGNEGLPMGEGNVRLKGTRGGLSGGIIFFVASLLVYFLYPEK